MVQPSVFGQAIIILVFVPMLTLHAASRARCSSRWRSTVIFALVAAFVLSLTFVPGHGRDLADRDRSARRRTSLIRGAKRVYEPLLRRALRAARGSSSGARRGAASSVSLLLFTRLGQEFVPTLDEEDIAMQAMRIPSTALDRSRQRCSCRSSGPSGAFPRWRSSSPRPARPSRDRPDAAQRLGHVHHPEAAGAEWPDPDAARKDAVWYAADRGGSRAALPGNNYEFTQPIQMRFNELIAGVRGDVAVKVYGDDFDQMQPNRQRDRSRAARLSGAEPT